MKKNLFLILLMATFCACSQNEDEAEETTILKFTANAETASFNGLQEGSVIGIYVVGRTDANAEGTLLQAGNTHDNQKFTFSDHALTAENKIYYPQDVPAFDIYAYAPYSANGLNENIQFPFTIASEQTDIKASDLLWAVTKGVKATTSNALSFHHMLSKIEITLTAGAGISLTSPSVKISNSLPTTTLDPKTGNLGAATGEKISIQAKSISSTSTTATFEAIIVPQNITTLEKFLTIVNDGKTYYHDLASSKVFKKGTIYKYNLIINADDLEITLSGDVTEWTPGDTTNDSLIKN